MIFFICQTIGILKIALGTIPVKSVRLRNYSFLGKHAGIN